MFNIETAYLSDEESNRLYETHPRLGSNPELYCPTCSKTGKYKWKGKELDCNCVYQLQLHKHYLASGIGVTYQRLDYGDYDGPEEVVESLIKYVENHQKYVPRGIGLTFPGEIGTGKTMLATLTLKELIKLGYKCYSTTFANTIEMFTAGWYNQEDKKYFQKKFVKSEVLLLDDLGRELRTKSKLSETTFDSILRTRVQEGRPTFITTNMTYDELREGYGSAVLSLLTEKSIVHEFNGEDFRQVANKRELKELQQGETRPIF